VESTASQPDVFLDGFRSVLPIYLRDVPNDDCQLPYQYLTANNLLIEVASEGAPSIYDANLRTFRWELKPELNAGHMLIPIGNGCLGGQILCSAFIPESPLDDYVTTQFLVSSTVLDQVDLVQRLLRPRFSRIIGHFPTLAGRTCMASFESIAIKALILNRCGFSEFAVLSHNHSGLNHNVEICGKAFSDRGNNWNGSFNSCGCYSIVKFARLCALFLSPN